MSIHARAFRPPAPGLLHSANSSLHTSRLASIALVLGLGIGAVACSGGDGTMPPLDVAVNIEEADEVSEVEQTPEPGDDMAARLASSGPWRDEEGQEETTEETAREGRIDSLVGGAPSDPGVEPLQPARRDLGALPDPIAALTQESGAQEPEAGGAKPGSTDEPTGQETPPKPRIDDRIVPLTPEERAELEAEARKNPGGLDLGPLTDPGPDEVPPMDVQPEEFDVTGRTGQEPTEVPTTGDAPALPPGPAGDVEELETFDPPSWDEPEPAADDEERPQADALEEGREEALVSTGLRDLGQRGLLFFVTEREGDFEFDFVSLGVGRRPEHPGASDFDVVPFLWINAAFEDFTLQSTARHLGLRAAFPLFDRVYAGPVIKVAPDRTRDEVDDPRLQQLPEVDMALELGLYAEAGLPGPLTDTDALTAEFELTTAVGGGHDGIAGRAEGAYETLIGNDLFLRPNAMVQYTSGPYNDSFYGVTGAQAAASGLSGFDSDGGFTTLGFGLDAAWFPLDDIGITARARYDFLLGEAQDNPVVRQAEEGTNRQVFLGLGIGLRF